jgi:hypothetical protein
LKHRQSEFELQVRDQFKGGTVKKVMFAFVTMLLFVGLAAAQTTPAPVQHFVMSGSAASFGGGSNMVAIASGGIQLTTNISVVGETISNPMDSSKPRVGSGLVNYTRSAASFVPARVRAKLLVDLTNYNVTFQAGAGRESFAPKVLGGPRTGNIVGNFGIFGSYPMPGGHSQLGLGYKFILNPANGNTVVKIPVGTLNFTF